MERLWHWTRKPGRPFSYFKGCIWGQKEPPIVFYAFDLLRLNGKDLRDLPIEERKAKLQELLKKPPCVIRYSVSFTKDIPELFGPGSQTRARRFDW
jgi:bifunctional non-homologous end joining protein LigD